MKVADAEVDVLSTLDALGLDVEVTRGEWGDMLCPLHPEERPSFSINLKHGGWICRHGGETGQLLDLVALVLKVERGEAARWVKQKYAPLRTPADLVVNEAPKWDASSEANIELVERYESLPTNVMSSYWFDRGFTSATMRKFGVRFDEEDQSLLWPVRDEQANFCGLIKRKLPGQPPPKYVYAKNFQRVLFPLDHFTGKSAILVEGPLDAMWLYQHGYMALAILGSDLPESMYTWLLHNVEVVTLAFDADPAGRTATKRIAKKLIGRLADTRVIQLPNGAKDIQEVQASDLDDVLLATEHAIKTLTGV